MLRVLTLSTLFPNAAQPTFGGFVERQTIGFAALPDVAVEVVAPIGLPPWPLARHPHYAARARLPLRESWKGLTVHRPRFPVLPRIGQSFSPRSMARTLLPLLREIRRGFAFDVIDAEFFWPDGPAAMRLAQALDVPFSIKARGSDIHLWAHRPAPAAQIIEAGRSADGLLSVSAALKRDMVALGMPEDRISVHYTGVDSEAFRPVPRASAKNALGIRGPLIASAGTLMRPKGQNILLHALRDLPDATLLLIGDGPDRPSLEQTATRLGLADRVRFLGNRPHGELPGLLAAADVMALPSQSEGLANVWVESLACGTPIVITDVGGARELLDRPGAGLIADRTAEAFGAAIATLLADPPDPDRVRSAAQRFSWDTNARDLRSALSRMVRDRPALSRSA